MNLFVIAWGAKKEEKNLIISALKEMTKVYPLLDTSTLVSSHDNDKVIFGCLSNSKEIIAPREYVHRHGNTVTFYDGSIFDATKKFCANKAKELAAYWHELEDALEGQFVAVKIDLSAPRLEVINDFLGVYQVYYIRQGNKWFVSNNVAILCKIAAIHEFDPLGVSMYLTLGWAGSDRTLRNGIRVLPGGQRWIWQHGQVEPIQNQYYDRTRLVQTGCKRLNKQEVAVIASKMVNNCKTLSENIGPFECPISAGKDSRLMSALVMKGGVDATYFTAGRPGTPDADIACLIAKHFKLSHELLETNTEELIENWDETSLRLIRQNDGMVSLAHILNAYNPPSEIDFLNVHLYGLGGEIARRHYYHNSAAFFVTRHTAKGVQKSIQNHMIRSADLVRRDALVQTQNYIKSFVNQAMDEGFSSVDIPNVFYTYERVRRWGGVNCRQVISHRDVYTPFCSRPFIEAAYSIPAVLRYTEHLIYELFNNLSPELHGMRFDEPWRNQKQSMIYFEAVRQKKRFYINKIKRQVCRQKSFKSGKNTRKTLRASWLEKKLPEIRELCLDQPRSQLWDFIDRDKFECLTHRDTPVIKHMRNHNEIFIIATLFHYAET